MSNILSIITFLPAVAAAVLALLLRGNSPAAHRQAAIRRRFSGREAGVIAGLAAGDREWLVVMVWQSGAREEGMGG